MTLDSNIVIAYLGGDQDVINSLSKWKESFQVIFLPAVVEAEVLSFSNFTSEEKLRTEEFLESLNFVSMDRVIARLSAEIRAKTNLKFPDAAIAATAIATQTPLVTRNTRDFKKVNNLTLISI